MKLILFVSGVMTGISVSAISLMAYLNYHPLATTSEEVRRHSTHCDTDWDTKIPNVVYIEAGCDDDDLWPTLVGITFSTEDPSIIPGHKIVKVVPVPDLETATGYYVTLEEK